MLMFIDIVETHGGYHYYGCNLNRSLVPLKLHGEGSHLHVGFRGLDAKSRERPHKTCILFVENRK